jgi:hypothetical protein
MRRFGLKRDELTGGWRKQHNEELHVLYSSPSIIKIIKSSGIVWAGHVARMEKRRPHVGFCSKARGIETTGKTKT